MVGQAHTPLVSGERSIRGPTVRWLTALNLGFLLGCSVVMVAAWVLGILTGMSQISMQNRLIILLAAMTFFFVFDAAAALRGKYSVLGLRRQTPKRLQMRLRGEATALVWGMDIGSGVSTYRVTSAIWLGLLTVFLGLLPVGAGLLYGAGLVVVVTAFISFIGGGEALHPRLPRLLKARRPIQLIYVISTMLVVVAVLNGLQVL